MSGKEEREPLLHSSSRREEEGDIDEVRFRGEWCSGLKKEFRWRNFGFKYPRKEAFYLSQWHMPASVFLLYRIVVAVYIVVWMFLTMRDQDTELVPYPWPCYLTNWSYFVLAAHLLLAALIALLYTPTRWGLCQTTSMSQFHQHYPPLSYSQDAASRDADISWYMKLDWLLFSIIANFAIIVTVIYWGALYPHMDVKVPPVTDINLHAVNTFVILLEMLLSALPVRLMHVIYPFTYGLCYMVFSVIFWAVNHDHVLYPGVLDWNYPATAAVVVLLLGFVVVPLLQLLMWCLFKLRQLMYVKICL